MRVRRSEDHKLIINKNKFKYYEKRFRSGKIY